MKFLRAVAASIPAAMNVPSSTQLVEGLEREVGIDRRRAVADQQRNVRHFARLTRLAHDSAARAQRGPNQVVVDCAGRKQHRDRRQLGSDAAVGQDQDARAAAHRALRLGAQALERGLESRAAFAGLEHAREGRRRESGAIELAQLLELLVRNDWMLDTHHARMLGRRLEQVALGTERRVERHHRALVDRIHRRVAHLREQLLEVAVEHLRPVAQARERRVLAHAPDRPLASAPIAASSSRRSSLV